MGKIGVITLFENNYNYGAYLQAFALQQYCINLGFESEIIKFLNSPKIQTNRSCFLRAYNKFKKTQTVGELLYEVERLIKKKKIHTLYEESQALKVQCFKTFEEGYLKCSKHYDSDTIQDSNNDYDIFICGSDQIWKPECYCDEYFLSFVNDGKLKIAYAPSIAINSLNTHEQEYMKKMIANLDFVSVREESGKKLLDSFIENKSISTVCDPTLLIDRQFWYRVCSQKRMVSEQYVFSYFLSPNYKAMKRIKKISNQMGYKVVGLAFNSGEHIYTEKFCDITLSDVSPLDFLNLIRFSEMVFTDSFHATVFSIIYKKEFFVLDRITDSKQQNMNSRIVSLLHECNADENMIVTSEIARVRLCKGQSISTRDYYNYLLEMQKYSREYLNNALGVNEE